MARLSALTLFPCLFLFGGIYSQENELPVVTVEKGGDVILPCSVNTDIKKAVFDWKKDKQNETKKKEVFFYNAGVHVSLDEQFKGRVSHFQDELRHGNASITINNTKMEDSGVYTCIFPRRQPSQTFSMKLVVVKLTLTDRSGSEKGAAPEPSVTILHQTNDWSQLQCKAHGNPEPTVQWKDSAGKILTAEDRQVTKRGDDFYVTVNITVTKTDTYSCVVTQETIGHQISAQTVVYIDEDSSSKVHFGWVIGGFILGVLFLAAVLFGLVKTKRIAIKFIKASARSIVEQHNGVCRQNGSGQQMNGFYSPASQNEPPVQLL